MNRTDRKKLLIAQGAAYRAEACIARQAVRDGLQPRSLAARVLRHVTRGSFAPSGGESGTETKGAALLRLLPLLGSVFSAVSKRKPTTKTLLRGALFAVAAAGVTAVIVRYNNAHRSDDRAA